MVLFPHCKINIGLQILNRRSDGYHNIATLFYPIPLHDALEVITSEELSFQYWGLPIPSNQEKDNLCLQAYHLLKQDFPSLPPVNIYLQKTIPTGAGLGGGSSNAAFMLRLLNKKYHLGLNTKELMSYASILGSDCGFFIQDKPCFAKGCGNELTPAPIDLSHYHFVLICPRLHIDTAWAYSRIWPKTPENPLEVLLKTPVSQWRDVVKNDFEEAVFEAHPHLAVIKKNLYEKGALYASLTGSGAAVYGIFIDKIKKEQLKFDKAKTFLF